MIQNVSGGPAPLFPYAGSLAPGKGVVVADDVPTVVANLGASAVGPVFRVTAVPDAGPVSAVIAQMTSAQIGSQAVGPNQLAVKDAHGASVGMIIDFHATAGVGGVADDVIIYDANAPFAFELEDLVFSVETPQAGSSVVMRDAKGGLGNALSSVLPTVAAGKQWDSGSALVPVAAGGTLVLRRSNNLVVGEIILHVVRVP